MAFDDLTEQQRELIKRLIEVEEKEGKESEFEIFHGIFGVRQSGEAMRFIDDIEKYRMTQFFALRDENYITLVVLGSDEYLMSLKPRAYEQYELSKQPGTSHAVSGTKGNVIQDGDLLARLGRSLERFKDDHPQPERCGFVMMRYAGTKQHQEIVEAVRKACREEGLEAVRADDKRYSDDLFDNVRAYMHSCGFGIAIIERLITNDFNPNVSLEIGYMMALGKPVCLLKDLTLQSLQTDLVGRLYETFDTQNPANSIPPVLEKWLKDKSLA